jgi:serine/threonine protein kinase, bacterial
MLHAAPLEQGMEPYPGYQLRRRRGRGGFAEVWEAVGKDGSVVALKFLPFANGSATPHEVRAIEAIRTLHHPNLIRVERVWCQPGYIVVAMELAEASLLDLFKLYQSEFGTPIHPEYVCELLGQAASALDFLNTRQHDIRHQRVAVQHRDVKPSNLLLFGDTVKLSDFGLAALMTTAEAPYIRQGTVEYSPPEVFQGALSNRSDQYSLAITYCHLRAGNLPFPNTPLDFDRRYVRPAPDLSILPSRERPVVARALAHVPQSRWPSCREFIAQLTKCLS